MDRKGFLRTALGVSAAAVVPASLAELVPSSAHAAVPSVVGTADVERVWHLVGVFAAVDRSHGGGLLREAAADELRHSVALLDARCAPRQRNELYSAVGTLAFRTAFMAFDDHANEEARRMFRLAQACAEETGDWRLRARALVGMAGQAIWHGDPDSGLTLVEMAMVRADRLTPTERAMLCATRGKALAMLGRAEDAASAVGAADQEFASGSADYPAGTLYDSTSHLHQTGAALAEPALSGRFAAEARNRLNTATAEYAGPRSRSRAMSAARLSSLTMATGDPVQAAAIGSRALADAGQVSSWRVLAEFRELRTLAGPHAKIVEVGELRSRIEALSAA